MFRKSIVILSLVACAAASQAISITFGNFTQNSGGGLGNGLFITHNGQNTFAGEILGKIGTTVYKFYCISPDKNLYLPSTVDYGVAVANGPMGVVGTHSFGGANANINEAARQLKLWAMTVPGMGTIGASGGNGTSVTSAVTLATGYTPTGSANYYVFTPNNGTQTLVSFDPGLNREQGIPAVPEPFSMAIAAAGFGLAVRRRIRK